MCTADRNVVASHVAIYSPHGVARGIILTRAQISLHRLPPASFSRITFLLRNEYTAQFSTLVGLWMASCKMLNATRV